MQLHVLVLAEETQRQRAHASKLRCNVVRIQPTVSDRHEISLWQPWDPTRGTQMHERPVGRADHHRGIALLRIMLA